MNMKERGGVIFAVVGLVTASVIMVTTMLVVTKWETQSQSLHLYARQAYWLARSIAARKLDEAKKNTLSVGQMTYQVGASQVLVNVQHTSDWQVTVEGIVYSAVDTVIFHYNPQIAQVTGWLDNSPPLK